MIGKLKKFNKKLYDKYDGGARLIVKKYIGDYVKDNPNIYEEDLLLNLDNCKYKYIELQVCAEWKDKIFPYKMPFIYERKIRFSDDTLFLLFNRDFSIFIMFDKKNIINKPERIKRYSRYFVYYFPWRYCLLSATDKLSIELIKIY